jgi:hypothetical protein
MSTCTEKLLARLNRKAIYVTFEEYNCFTNTCDIAHAFYFGVAIQIAFPNTPAEIRRNEDASASFWIELFEEEFVYVENSPYELFDREALHFDDALMIINDYIRSRPFKILKVGRSKYSLFDPNGNWLRSDLTLKQARLLSDHNVVPL